jgi:PAS domain S-box-containing protein
MEKSIEHIQLEQAHKELQMQLREANDIIEAIRAGEVDALVVNGENGHQLFTLKTADQSYRIFIEQMTESALTLDLSGRILYCNSNFADFFKVPLEKAIGTEFLDFVPLDNLSLAKEIIDAAWTADTKIELELQNGEGKRVCTQLSLKALNLDEGTALSIIITDLSEIKRNQSLLEIRNEELEESRRTTTELNENLERIVNLRTLELEAKNKELATAIKQQSEVNRQLKIALESLKESEDNLSSAFNAGDLGSCSLDLKTGKAEMSERFRLLYGLPVTGDLDWKMILACVDPVYIPELEQILKDCLSSGTPVDCTYPIIHCVSGERRWMRVVGKVKKDFNGQFSSVSAVLMDVTDQKQDEQRKNDFIAMVSHELKTPLTSMKGYIQFMQLKARKEESMFAGKALEGAERQINKMTSMINGFLNLSRLESGKLLLEQQPLEIASLIKEIMDEYSTTVTSHHLTFSCQKGLFVNADRDKLGHVISNLVSNAVKYSPADSRIDVDSYQEENNVIFRVCDEGMGIHGTDLPKLFERFYRAETPQMATVSGFGIGLYLSAEIIARHGGKIWAESKLGIGSVFYFSLPLIAQP